MLEDIFGSKSKIRIVRAMMKNEEREWCLDDVVRATGQSCGVAHPALRQLSDARIVIKRIAGKTPLYRINKSHFLLESIRRLLKTEKEGYLKIVRKFSDELDKTGIRSIVLFGSVARGDFTQKSDIDILIVGGELEKIKASATKLSGKFLDEYDINISLIVLSVRDAEERAKKLDQLIANVLEDGIILYGDTNWSEI